MEPIDVAGAYAEHDTAWRQVNEAGEALATTLRTFQPTSGKAAEARDCVRLAGERLARAEGPKRRADVAVCRELPAQIKAKQERYNELVKELLPTAPEPSKLTREIEALQGKFRAFPVIIQFEARHGPLREGDPASWLALADVAAGDIGDKYDRAAALQAVAVAKARAGDIPGARRAIAAMPEGAGYPGEAVSEVAALQAARGDLAGAAGTAALAPGGGDKAAALTAVGVASARRGDRAGARRLFEQARAAAAASTGPFARTNEVRGLLRLPEGQAAAGDGASARATLKAAASRSPDSVCLRETCVMQAKLGFIDDAQAAVAGSQELKLDLDVAVAIAIAQAAAKDPAAGKATLETSAKFFEGSRLKGLAGIAAAQVRNGDREGARVTAKEAHDLATTYVGRNNLYDLEESGRAALSEYDADRKRKQRERSQDWNAQAWLHLAEAQAWAGDIPGATTTIDRIPTGDYKSAYTRATALHEVGKIQLMLGDRGGARQTLRAASNSAGISRTEGHSRGTWDARDSIAILQAELGDTEGAAATLKLVGDPTPKAVRAFAAALGKVGNTAEVAPLLKREPCWAAVGAAEGLMVKADAK